MNFDQSSDSLIRSGPQSTDQKLATAGTNGGTPRHEFLATDGSVIGTPFPVSASVEAACNRDKIACPLMYQQLTKFAQEPRDSAWAAQTEATLQEQIESQGPGKYSIRNIECRTSVCAVEVSSLFGQYFGVGFYGHVKYSLMPGLAPIWQATVGADEQQVVDREQGARRDGDFDRNPLRRITLPCSGGFVR